MRGLFALVVLSQIPLPSAWPWPTVPPPLPSMPTTLTPTPAAPVTFARKEISFKPRSGAAKTTLLDKDGEDGWVSPDGKTMLTAYGHSAKLHRDGKVVASFKTSDVLDVAFSADSTRVALVQAVGPLTSGRSPMARCSTSVRSAASAQRGSAATPRSGCTAGRTTRGS